MAAYGGLVSLINLMEQINLYDARNPIFDHQQKMQLQTLSEKVIFLQKFLETYSNCGRSEGECLESQITDAVYTAEDVIELHVVDDIHSRSTSTVKSSDHLFSQGLDKAIQDMDFIQKQAMEIEENGRLSESVKPRVLTSSSGGLPVPTNGPIVVFESSPKGQIMEKLTRQHTNHLETIPITGMGGIGKTTLVQHIYDDPLTKRHFDVLGWVTVSQEFNPRKTLYDLLCKIGVLDSKSEADERIEYHELGSILHRHLTGRRYLVVLDDIWNLEAWEKVSLFLPDNGKGSRVLITTRQSNLANSICSTNVYKLNLLDDDESWSLLQKKVFVQGNLLASFPDLEEIGMRIAKSCKGLPLSIAVIGGVLSKVMDREHWESVAEDTSAAVNLEHDEHVYQILYTSYRHLPVHLRPCFLYLGSFPEDHSIKLSYLQKLWIDEGFLKPKEGKILEEVARDYMNDLIDRNLIYVEGFGSTGDVKSCKLHDLLRDFCLREAIKQKFLYVANLDDPDDKFQQGFIGQRRVVICSSSKSDEMHSARLINALQLASSSIRSVDCGFGLMIRHPLNGFKLLRVVGMMGNSYNEHVFSELVNSRFLNLGYLSNVPRFPSSICLLWNLRTLVFNSLALITLPSEIWEMSQLRHILGKKLEVDDPSCGEGNNAVLENLQTLGMIVEFRCSEEVLEKLPNLRKLKVRYRDCGMPPEYLQNLGSLTKLESLYCGFVYNFPDAIRSTLEFPISLKKLTIRCHDFNWKIMGGNIGSLPYLEKFRLYYSYYPLDEQDQESSSPWAEEWNLVEEEELFPQLKYLHISSRKLIRWTAEGSHFPCLEHLVLDRMYKLEDIPPEIGDIPTLQSITLEGCTETAVESAKRILEEQRSYDNNGLVVTIKDTYSSHEIFRKRDLEDFLTEMAEDCTQVDQGEEISEGVYSFSI